jgi:hypothetical protein
MWLKFIVDVPCSWEKFQLFFVLLCDPTLFSAVVSFYLYHWGILKFSNRKVKACCYNETATKRDKEVSYDTN